MSEEIISDSGWEELRAINECPHASKPARMLWLQIRIYCSRATRQLCWTRDEFLSRFGLSARSRKNLLAELREIGALAVHKTGTGRVQLQLVHPSRTHPRGKICTQARGQNLHPGTDTQGAKVAPWRVQKLHPGRVQKLHPAYIDSESDSGDSLQSLIQGGASLPAPGGDSLAAAPPASAASSPTLPVLDAECPASAASPSKTPTPKAPAPSRRVAEATVKRDVSASIVPATKGDPFGLNPSRAAVLEAKRLGTLGGLDGREDVLFDPATTKLRLVNGVKAAFEREFPGLDIDAACDRVVVKRGMTALEVKQLVRKELSYMRERAAQKPAGGQISPALLRLAEISKAERRAREGRE